MMIFSIKHLPLTKTALLNKFVSVSKSNLFKRRLQKQVDSNPVTDVFNMEKERESFMRSLPETIDLHVPQSQVHEVPEISDRMKLVLHENLTGGKYFRGISTVLAYKCMEDPGNITEESLRRAQNLGWCVETLQAYYIICDDIMDSSKKRRGKPCWYLRPDTGLSLALNDSIMTYGFMIEMLKNNVGNLPNYPQFINAFNETLLYTSMGQYLDIVIGQREKDYSMFTSQRNQTIAKYKTACYTYKLPVTIGLLLIDKMNEENTNSVNNIVFDLGYLFQMQDDYIDCFGDESVTGKIGTDIQEGKCSWLAAKALERCNRRQLTVFSACYGSSEPAHIERVKQLYVELKLPQCYKEEENKIYNNLVQKINNIHFDGLRNVFFKLLDLTYKRKK